MDAPPHVRELVEACREAVLRALAFDLDFEPETLPVLDHYLAKADAKNETIVDLVASMAGAYFGEVVRRRADSAWHAPPGEFTSWRVEFRRCFLHFNPIGMAREAILRTDEEGWGAAFEMDDADRAAIEASIARLPPIGRTDFYRLATRFEVLTLILDYLIASERGERTYDAAYYSAAIGEAPPAGNA